MKLEDIYFKAMKARDPHYNGKFFVSVKNSGIYCRPTCTITPQRQNFEFFHLATEAEESGYSPCLRCQPDNNSKELNKIDSSVIVQRALKMMDFYGVNEFNEDKFADLFGVTARNLRRLFFEKIGKTPKQIYFEKRLTLLKNLIFETSHPINNIIPDAEFNSAQRFNDAFNKRFQKNSNEVFPYPIFKSSHSEISLPYILPFNFKGLINFYKAHQTGDLEWFVADKMFRVINLNGKVGLISIANDHKNSCILLNIDFPDVLAFPKIIARVKILMDLNIDPEIIIEKLSRDEKIKVIVEKHPGIRLPSGWDAFEISIFTILGQSISMQKNQKNVSNLIKLLGEDSGLDIRNRSIKLFPTVEKILISDLSSLKITSDKKQILIDFCKRIVEKTITFDPKQDVTEFSDKVLAVKGTTSATVQCLSLRILNHADIFPDTNFVFAQILELHEKAVIDRMAPYRGYLAALLWVEYIDKLKNLDNKKNELLLMDS